MGRIHDIGAAADMFAGSPWLRTLMRVIVHDVGFAGVA